MFNNLIEADLVETIYLTDYWLIFWAENLDWYFRLFIRIEYL